MTYFPPLESKIPELLHKGISPRQIPDFESSLIIETLDACRISIAAEFNRTDTQVHHSSNFHYRSGLLFAVNVLSNKIKELKDEDN